MDPNQLNFPLRSGHSVTGQQAPIDWNNVRTVMSLMMVFNQQACEDGMKYANAAGRQVMTARDFILGLKYNAVPSTSFYTIDGLQEKVRRWREHEGMNEMMQACMTGSTLLESEDEEEEEEQAVDDICENEEVWTRAPETHVLAQKMHAAEIEFESWDPPAEAFEQRAIKRAITRAILELERQEIEEEENTQQ